MHSRYYSSPSSFPPRGHIGKGVQLSLGGMMTLYKFKLRLILALSLFFFLLEQLANKLNHQLDALGRSVEKYRPGHRSSSSESSTIRSKFPKLNQHNLSIVKEQMDDDHKIYKTARIVYDTAELARAAVLEFHHQRYLPRDLIRKRLRCEFE